MKSLLATKLGLINFNSIYIIRDSGYLLNLGPRQKGRGGGREGLRSNRAAAQQ